MSTEALITKMNKFHFTIELQDVLITANKIITKKTHQLLSRKSCTDGFIMACSAGQKLQ